MTSVRVCAPARVHLGMLEVAAGSCRRFGGVGLAVSDPAVVIEASAADELSVDGLEHARARAFAERTVSALGLEGGVRLTVVDSIPAHIGLGSGTKLGLAVAQAVAAVHGLDLDPAELARVAGRAARSAVGLWTFALGGLVVEGGVRPASTAPSPLVARYDVPPEWRCVLAVPDCEPGLSGTAEETAFKELPRRPELAALVSQLILTALLPALVERDIAEFGRTVTQVQRLVGEAFAPAQGGSFHPRSGELVEAFLAFGAAGAGQSSWGPATYGFAASESEAWTLAKRMSAALAGRGWVSTLQFDNSGAAVEMLCASS